MRADWTQGRYADVARKVEKRARKKDGGKDGVIWNLEAGAALRAAGQFEASNIRFDAAAMQIEEYERKAQVRVGNEVGSTMTNPQNLPYEGRAYDKIMLHTYKALNYLALGEIDKARPELIRAYQYQQDAVRDHARRIEKAREEARTNPRAEQVQAAENDPVFSSELNRMTRNLEGFQFYADYVNPFTVYLDGLYFLYAGTGGSDLERARKSLSRVLEVAGDNPNVRADVQAIERNQARRPDTSVTYVIFETGMAASRAQERIDIPIIVAEVSYIGAAFPRLEFHDNYARSLSVSSGTTRSATDTLASMDSIIALDFKNEWPVIVTRTVISAVAKGATAYAINRAANSQSDWGGLIAQIGTAIAQAALNIADTRSWETLPKEFQVARFETPEDHTLVLSTGGGAQSTVNLMDGQVNVVYVKSVTATSPLSISQFKLR